MLGTWGNHTSGTSTAPLRWLPVCCLLVVRGLSVSFSALHSAVRSAPLFVQGTNRARWGHHTCIAQENSPRRSIASPAACVCRMLGFLGHSGDWAPHTGCTIVPSTSVVDRSPLLAPFGLYLPSPGNELRSMVHLAPCGAVPEDDGSAGHSHMLRSYEAAGAKQPVRGLRSRRRSEVSRAPSRDVVAKLD